MIKIEIASYPKSGNTWLRHLTQEYLSQLGGNDFYLPPDIHKELDKVKMHTGQYIEAMQNNVLIYKSHLFDHPAISPDWIFHIYRHPLDVFLSTRNYLFIKSHKFDSARLHANFLDGVPKSIEDIVRDNQMDYYLNAFAEDAGGRVWTRMLGANSNYFNYMQSVEALSNVVAIKYEDLFADPVTAVNAAFRAININLPDIDFSREKIDNRTRLSGNKKFYWQARARNFEKFLTPQQIELFTSRHQALLGKWGYL